jgi:hypothetical protein
MIQCIQVIFLDLKSPNQIFFDNPKFQLKVKIVAENIICRPVKQKMTG